LKTADYADFADLERKIGSLANISPLPAIICGIGVICGLPLVFGFQAKK
jgi:hypothetical protein